MPNIVFTIEYHKSDEQQFYENRKLSFAHYNNKKKFEINKFSIFIVTHNSRLFLSPTLWCGACLMGMMCRYQWQVINMECYNSRHTHIEDKNILCEKMISADRAFAYSMQRKRRRIFNLV